MHILNSFKTIFFVANKNYVLYNLDVLTQQANSIETYPVC